MRAQNQPSNQSPTLDLAREAVVMEVKDAASGSSHALGAGSIDQQASRVFVSPRVVDERAFDQLASTLRGLTNEAAQQARGLSQASDGVRTLSENLRGLTKDLTTRTEQAAKVLPLLETRVASAQQLVDRVTRDMAIVKAREARDAISAHIVEQTPQWKQEFVAQAKQAMLEQAEQEVASLVQQQIPAMIAQQVRSQVHGAIELAVREALATLKSDVSQSVHEGASKNTGAGFGGAGFAAPSRSGLFQASPMASDSASGRGSMGEPSLRDALARAEDARVALEAAASKAQLAGTQLEQNVEDVAGEISQQLAALRADTHVIVGGASARIEGAAATAAEHAAKQALSQAHNIVKSQLLQEITNHVGEMLEPELTRQEASTIEAIVTAQHAAYEQLSTLVANAEQAAHAAAERLGAAVAEARGIARTLGGSRVSGLGNTGADAQERAVYADHSQPASTLAASSLLAQLQQQTDLGTQLLLNLSERVEAASHATDAIVQALAEVPAMQPVSYAPMAHASGVAQHGATHSEATAAAIAAAGKASQQLAQLLSHTAQAGQWLQSITQHAHQTGMALQAMVPPVISASRQQDATRMSCVWRTEDSSLED
jgi:hypothetical protein